MRIWVLCVWICISVHQANAQIDNLQAVKGLPSDEVYDLLADSKGFIWAAHSLGVSRYDGINFKDFNHPLANGAGITDLCEDKQGRIWCHNFNGQVFYIENEKMYLLDAYKYRDEAFYPRMIILGDELLVTTQKGLFVLNTGTFSSKYIYSNSNNKASSVAIVGGKAYVCNGDFFMSYTPNKPLKQFFFKDISNTKVHLIFSGFQLQPITTNDTIYARYINKYTCKFIIKKDTVFLIDFDELGNFVNTITGKDKSIWINTKKISKNEYLNERIYNTNISDIIKDNDNNYWFSSLEKGLLTNPKNKFWQVSHLDKSLDEDRIRCNLKSNKCQYYGTQKGQLFIKDLLQNKMFKILKFPDSNGSIENLFRLNENYILITPSVGSYLLDIRTNKVFTLMADHLTIKNIQIYHENILLSYTNSLVKYTLPIKDYANTLAKNLKYGISLSSKRCYGTVLNYYSNTIFAAFKDGLHELKDSIFYPVLYKNDVISASSLLSIKNKTFATTFNNGLFIIDKNGIRQKTTNDGLLSNKVLKLKFINEQLFILEQENIQILDINSEKIIKTIALPTEKSGVIYDLWQEDNLLYLSSNKALYKLNLSSLNNTITPLNYILSVTSDTSVFPVNKPLELPYSKNNIQFKVISPSFIYPEYTYFNYRIKGDNDTSWEQTTTNESNIAFAALEPGDYTFEAYAVNFQNSKGKPISFQFTILKPWWQQWWFTSLVILMLFFIAVVIFKLRFKIIAQKNKEVVEKLALTSELRKSQLSTIVAQMNPHFIFNTLNTIQGLIYKNDKMSSTKYIGKFSELVRDILNNSNNQEITLSEEINHINLYLELEKMRFEDELHITLHVEPTLDKSNIMLPPMLIQPYIENAIVHGLFHKKGAKDLAIFFNKSQKENYLEIIIDDNGIGRDMSQQLNAQRRKHISFAISAIEKRISLLNQTLTRKIEISIIDKHDAMQNAIGTSVTILIPINQ